MLMCGTLHTFIDILASLYSPPWLYHWTVKPPMAPLGHIADIPVVGPELHSVISPKTLSLQSLEGLLCRLESVKAAEYFLKY